MADRITATLIDNHDVADCHALTVGNLTGEMSHKYNEFSTTYGVLQMVGRSSSLSLVFAAFLLSGASVGTIQPAWGAGDAPVAEGSLAEVVVTARKREERLIDVPISVQAFSEAELKASGATDLKTLQATAGFEFLPMVGTAAAGRTFGALTFRGLAPDVGAAYENSGSLFIDGVFVSAGLGSVNTADLERVEVLKGPQNAFFGRSTFGGAINFITRNPTKNFQGHLNASTDNLGSRNVDLSLGGPLWGDKLSGRLLLLSTHKAGQYTASDGGKLGEENTQSITATLYATPTDKLWIRLRGHYQQDDDSAAAIGYIPGDSSCVGRVFSGQTGTGVAEQYALTRPYICGSVPRLGSAGTLIDANTALPPSIIGPIHNSLGDPFIDSAPSLDHSGMRRNVFRIALQAGYTLPHDVDWAFNIGYNRANSVSVWDLDRAPINNFMNIQPLLSNDLTADMRLSTSKSKRLRGLLGASYFSAVLRFSQIDLNAAFGSTAFVLNTGNYSDNHSSVPAVYGSLEYDLLDQLTLTGDLRYQTDKITDFKRLGAGQLTDKTSKLMPRVILSYKPIRDTNLYASWAKGVQPLTVNNGYAGASALARTYLQTIIPGISDYSVPPELTNFELGIKQRLFEGRFEYALVAYHAKWAHRTTNTFVFNPDSCAGQPTNTAACPLPLSGLGATFANDATIKGLEFTSNGLITNKWNAGLSLTWTHARWTNYYNANFGSWTTPVVVGNSPVRKFDGNTIARQPDLTGSLTTTFRDRLNDAWNWYVRGDMRYTGKMYSDDLNIIQSDPYTRVNAHLGLENDKLSLELYTNNLLNDTHWDYIYRLPDLRLSPLVNFSTQGLGVGVPNKREFGLKVSYSF